MIIKGRINSQSLVELIFVKIIYEPTLKRLLASFRVLKRVQHKFISESLTPIKSIDPDPAAAGQDDIAYKSCF